MLLSTAYSCGKFHASCREHILQTSPGKNAVFPSIYLPHLLQMIPRSFWTLTCLAALSSFTAFYVISVRQARGLLSSSFRFHLAVDTLEVPLLPSRYGAASGLSPFRLRPCWAHYKNRAPCERSSVNLIVIQF